MGRGIHGNRSRLQPLAVLSLTLSQWLQQGPYQTSMLFYRLVCQNSSPRSPVREERLAFLACQPHLKHRIVDCQCMHASMELEGIKVGWLNCVSGSVVDPQEFPFVCIWPMFPSYSCLYGFCTCET